MLTYNLILFGMTNIMAVLNFWLTVEESDRSEILHVEKFILHKKQLHSPHEMDFMIPLSDPLPAQVVVRVVSDLWIGSETVHAVHSSI